MDAHYSERGRLNKGSGRPGNRRTERDVSRVLNSLGRICFAISSTMYILKSDIFGL